MELFVADLSSIWSTSHTVVNTPLKTLEGKMANICRPVLERMEILFSVCGMLLTLHQDFETNMLAIYGFNLTFQHRRVILSTFGKIANLYWRLSWHTFLGLIKSTINLQTYVYMLLPLAWSCRQQLQLSPPTPPPHPWTTVFIVLLTHNL